MTRVGCVGHSKMRRPKKLLVVKFARNLAQKKNRAEIGVPYISVPDERERIMSARVLGDRMADTTGPGYAAALAVVAATRPLHELATHRCVSDCDVLTQKFREV